MEGKRAEQTPWHMLAPGALPVGGPVETREQAQAEIERLRRLAPQVCHGDDRDPIAEAVERVTGRRVYHLEHTPSVGGGSILISNEGPAR